MAAKELTCERDGTSTLLTCVQCRKAICTECLVRTPVGMKCEICGAEPGTTPFVRSRRPPRWIAALALLLLVAGVIALPRLITGDSEEGPLANPVGNDIQGPARVGSGLGQEARDGDLAFVVSSVDCSATQVSGAMTRTAQGKFCFVAMEIRNTSRGPVRFESAIQLLFDGQNRQFGPDPAATAAHPANDGRDLLSPVINPGNVLQGTLVFDVPQDVTPVAANLRESQAGRGSYVILRPRG